MLAMNKNKIKSIVLQMDDLHVNDHVHANKITFSKCLTLTFKI